MEESIDIFFDNVITMFGFIWGSGFGDTDIKLRKPREYPENKVVEN